MVELQQVWLERSYPLSRIGGLAQKVLSLEQRIGGLAQKVLSFEQRIGSLARVICSGNTVVLYESSKMGKKKYDKAAHGRHVAKAPHVNDNKQTSSYSPSHVNMPNNVYAPVGTSVRRRKPLKVFGIILCMLAVLLGVAYLGVSVYFIGHFMPHSAIADIDISLMSTSEVQQVLSATAKDHSVSVVGQGFSLKLEPADIKLTIDENEVADRALAQINPWAWPFELGKNHDMTGALAVSFNREQLENILRDAVTAFNETAVSPQDAFVVYNEAANAFTIQPEAIGTKLNPDAVVNAVDKAIASLGSTAKLTAEQLQKPEVFANDQRLKAAMTSANAVITADFSLKMGGSVVGEVNADLISQWIVFNDTGAALNDEALIAWVDELAAACTTVGAERAYTRPDGKEITVAGGPYGFSVDRDALLNLVQTGVSEGATQDIEVPVTSEGAVYNGAGAQDWGTRYCDIDLSEQRVRFFDESGTLIWEAPCVSGNPNPAQATPTGVYWINLKGTQVKLKGTNLDGSRYESQVRYWMPFVDNAIGLHDADWQPSYAFGTDWYRKGGGSHGCVNLPVGAAAELYEIIEVGDVVVSHW